MEIIKKDGNIYLKVIYKSPIEDEGTMEWLFKEMAVGDFMNLEITEKEIKSDTLIGKNMKPMIYMINAMMIKGDPITNKTPNRIFAFIKDELGDFLS